VDASSETTTEQPGGVAVSLTVLVVTLVAARPGSAFPALKHAAELLSGASQLFLAGAELPPLQGTLPVTQLLLAFSQTQLTSTPGRDRPSAT